MAKSDLIQEIIAENPEAEFTEEQLDKDYTIPQFEELQQELREKKESAEDEKEAQADPTPKYKLKDPKSFYGEGSFVLYGEKTEALPNNPSTELLARIKSGFIIEVK